jgi:RNA polymerase sigma-70 factor (ECF subfamily)
MDASWVDTVLTGARPQAVAALLRYFRDLSAAEEAFQEASLRALRTWPRNGPPRDPVGWLAFVGRNAGIDASRKAAKQVPLDEAGSFEDPRGGEDDLVDRLDMADYRDDLLRLLFICCHPALPDSHQIALALRIVCGVSVAQIARGFLVSEAAMEQRITRAKARVAGAEIAFGPPTPLERAERLNAVATTIYLIFNAGYSASPLSAAGRAAFCAEAIRLSRLLIQIYPGEPELLGLTALMLLQDARTAARVDSDNQVVLLDQQDRTLWNRNQIAEGLALIEKAMRHAEPGPFQVQAAIAALHARAARPELTDWAQIDRLYATLERMSGSPVVSLNRAVALAKVAGPEAALQSLEPHAEALSSYFYFHGVRGALLRDLHRLDEAQEAFRRAITCASSGEEAAHIRMQLDQLASADSA